MRKPIYNDSRHVKSRERSRRYREANPEKVLAASLACTTDPVYRAAEARRIRVRKYGLPWSNLVSLLESQGNVCIICQKRIALSGRNGAHVDHSHDAGGGVRGILCDTCNRGLGQFKDNASLLRAAADYLDAYNNRGLVPALTPHEDANVFLQ